MKYLDHRGVIFFLIIDAILVAVAVSALFLRREGELSSRGMRIASPAFQDGGTIPAEYTCDGHGGHPPLSFEGVPYGTRSLALIVEDPDASFGTWTHWVLWGIAPTAPGIAEGSLPEGAQPGRTSADAAVWQGPCPPFGTHRYVFRLYALDAQVWTEAGGTDADGLRAQMEGHVIESAELTGRYERTR
jgi:Raf kinase inhibitor-like YbhB/YbcL family protein